MFRKALISAAISTVLMTGGTAVAHEMRGHMSGDQSWNTPDRSGQQSQEGHSLSYQEQQKSQQQQTQQQGYQQVYIRGYLEGKEEGVQQGLLRGFQEGYLHGLQQALSEASRQHQQGNESQTGPSSSRNQTGQGTTSQGLSPTPGQADQQDSEAQQDQDDN